MLNKKLNIDLNYILKIKLKKDQRIYEVRKIELNRNTFHGYNTMFTLHNGLSYSLEELELLDNNGECLHKRLKNIIQKIKGALK